MSKPDPTAGSSLAPTVGECLGILGHSAEPKTASARTNKTPVRATLSSDIEIAPDVSVLQPMLICSVASIGRWRVTASYSSRDVLDA
jgi:hypothetical protein